MQVTELDFTMDVIFWKDKLKCPGSNKVNLIIGSTNKSRDYLLLTDIIYMESNANEIIIN